MRHIPPQGYVYVCVCVYGISVHSMWRQSALKTTNGTFTPVPPPTILASLPACLPASLMLLRHCNWPVLPIAPCAIAAGGSTCRCVADMLEGHARCACVYVCVCKFVEKLSNICCCRNVIELCVFHQLLFICFYFVSSIASSGWKNILVD